MALALPAAETLPAGVPEPLRNALRQRQRRMLLRGLQQTAAVREVVIALQRAGLRCCLLKGHGYAALFGQAHREACDIDVLIEAHALHDALSTLQTLGYALQADAAADLAGYCRRNHALPLQHPASGVVLELHLRLANHERQFPLSAEVWRDHLGNVTLAGMQVPTLSPPAAVVYAAFHGTKHHWHRAFWLVDMAHALCSPQLDWDAVLALARRLGVERQLALSALLVEASLGVALPDALQRQSALLRAARPAAAALLPCLDALGSDRGADLAVRLGVTGYARYLLSLQSRWRGRLGLLPGLLAPTDADRLALPLPRALRWVYPGVRVVRLTLQHLHKQRDLRRARQN
ncbi:nucleotidyltransferase family protein [Xanthomonas maliensis]|nr:nucleotidyltransferase family protein [Xanthomonas maliensis]